MQRQRCCLFFRVEIFERIYFIKLTISIMQLYICKINFSILLPTFFKNQHLSIYLKNWLWSYFSRLLRKILPREREAARIENFSRAEFSGQLHRELPPPPRNLRLRFVSLRFDSNPRRKKYASRYGLGL